MGEFGNLPTVRFMERMKPAALRIYRRVFPGCEIRDLRTEGVEVHVLDKEFGIDSLIQLPSNQWISLQEKYRTHEYLKYCDFTQEFMNGVGTDYESPGEWFKLGAQLYFYGWANQEESEFDRWFIMDIPRYKLLVETSGGLDHLGTLHQNSRHGRASFYAIKLPVLKPCIVAYWRQYQNESP